MEERRERRELRNPKGVSNDAVSEQMMFGRSEVERGVKREQEAAGLDSVDTKRPKTT